VNHEACKCRETQKLFIEDGWRYGGISRHAIRCETCGRRGPWALVPDMKTEQEHDDATWAAWDADHAPDPRLEKAREALLQAKTQFDHGHPGLAEECVLEALSALEEQP
jgi:hypothetical protein